MIYSNLINEERTSVAFNSSSANECAFSFITISGVSPIILATVVTETPLAI